MGRKAVCVLVLLALMISVAPVLAPASTPGPSPGSGGGGGSSLNMDKFINYLKTWQNQDPVKFDVIKTLLFKELYTKEGYLKPRVNIIYNRTMLNISRNDKVEIKAYVENPNSEEIRRALFLRLEVKGPDETVFKPIGTREIVQTNDYDIVNKKNITTVEFPDLTSFHYLRKVGKVDLRINVSDGKNKYTSANCESSPSAGYFSILHLNIYNVPPQINNSTMKVTQSATWDGFVDYRAQLNNTNIDLASSEKEKNILNVTLHIYNETDGTEKFRISKEFPEGDEIFFNTKDATFFSEKDAGKNFTYRFSVCDGILGGSNTTWSENRTGPSLKKSAKITVSVPQPNGLDAEDKSNYWWHKYSFSVQVKSMDPEVKSVRVTLLTDTPDHRGRVVSSPSNPMTKAVSTDNFTTYDFTEMKPFDVMDAGKTFSYYFAYDIEDKNGSRQTDLMVGSTINSKVLYYSFFDFPGIWNLLFILLTSLVVGILMERSLFRRGGV